MLSYAGVERSESIGFDSVKLNKRCVCGDFKEVRGEWSESKRMNKQPESFLLHQLKLKSGFAAGEFCSWSRSQGRGASNKKSTYSQVR